MLGGLKFISATFLLASEIIREAFEMSAGLHTVSFFLRGD